jgi:hypothetical protein
MTAVVVTCLACPEGRHRFCYAGSCDFCGECKRHRQSLTASAEPWKSAPEITAEQAVRVLRILSHWIQRGWWYETPRVVLDGGRSTVIYTNPDDDSDYSLESSGVNHFDALCQATTAMQLLLELYPEKP